jgi:hypothetical protein
MALAACGGAGVAATVNGVDVTVDEIDALVVSDGAIPEEEFVGALEGRIVLLAVQDAAEADFEIVADEAVVEAQYQDFVNQVTASGGGDYAASLEANGLTDGVVRDAALSQVISDALVEQFADSGEGVTDDDVAAELEASGESYTNACLNHILLESEDEALEAKAELDGFEPTDDKTLEDRFNELAMEISIDPSAATAGSSLGCQLVSLFRTNLVPEFMAGFDAAEVGVVTDPVESEFGFHLILVASLDDEATVSAAARTALEANAQTGALVEWIESALRGADITVEERYGAWVDDPQPGIQPPQDTSDSTAATATTTG